MICSRLSVAQTDSQDNAGVADAEYEGDRGNAAKPRFWPPPPNALNQIAFEERGWRRSRDCSEREMELIGMRFRRNS